MIYSDLQLNEKAERRIGHVFHPTSAVISRYPISSVSALSTNKDDMLFAIACICWLAASYRMNNPPSTKKFCPVIYFPVSTTKSIIEAISAGFPILAIGISCS